MLTNPQWSFSSTDIPQYENVDWDRSLMRLREALWNEAHAAARFAGNRNADVLRLELDHERHTDGISISPLFNIADIGNQPIEERFNEVARNTASWIVYQAT
jgi:hypothetical protein